MSRWKVQKIGDMWEATDPAGEYTQAFLWWHVAMAYSDILARTIEVTLPRTPNHTTGTMTTHKSGDGILLTLNTPGAPIQARITQHELKPLALALLAQHYQQEHHEC